MRGARFALAATAVVLVVGEARADAPPQTTVSIGADSAEVGEPFTVELKVVLENGASNVGDPQLNPPVGLTAEGPRISTQVVMNGFGSRSTVRTTIGATWTLVGQRTGRFTIPSPTVVWGGKRLGGGTVSIQITRATGRPRQRQQPQGNNPFLMPGGPGFSWPFQNEPAPAEEEPPETNRPDLAMPVAPDPTVFVHAIVDKKSVVVGEQATVSFYIYHAQNVHLVGRQEAPLADFVRIPVLKDPRTEADAHVFIGSRRYRVQLLDRVGIFPLRTGELHTGGMRMSFTDELNRKIGDRLSEDLVLHVTEPPTAGRPPGYALGDVGQLALSATVQPRRVDQGGSIAVTLKVEGSGNLPEALHLPEHVGVEWLEPEKKESIEPQGGVVRGWRTFGYVVRIKESGPLDLGEVTLPYWDPTAKKYQVARARLGAVEVKPVAPTIDPATKLPTGAGDTPKVDPFATLPGARATLGAYTPPRARLLDGSALWFLVAAPPLLVGMFSAGTTAVRRTRARRESDKDAPAALVARALREAGEAEARGDAGALCAALERATHLAIEAATGLKSRGVLVAELPEELVRRGLPRELGDRAASVLADADAIRFDPAPDTERTRELAIQVRALVADLGRRGAA